MFWIVIRYFLLEKEAFNGLLKVIGIQSITTFYSYEIIFFEIINFFQ